MANCKFIFSLPFVVLFSIANGQLLKDYDAQKLVYESKQVWIDRQDSTLKFIEFHSSGEKSRLISRFKLQEELKLAEGSTFENIDQSTDRLGFQHIRTQQYFKGIPVEGAIYRLHGKGGILTKANGIYHNIKNLEIKPKINRSEAYSRALKYTLKNLSDLKTAVNEGSDGKLVLYPSGNTLVLAYKFDIYTMQPLTHNFVYVNALTGEIAGVEDRIRMEDATGTAITKYHSVQSISTEKNVSNYRLTEHSRGNGIQTLNLSHSNTYLNATDFTDIDNYWNTTSNQDDAATSIHYSIEKSYDFFHIRFQRNSFDNSGSIIRSYVHYDSLCNNAFWDGSRLFFGDGDGKKYNAFASTDIVAHEYTHAITDNTADLMYYGESGALNESFSDIFGVAIDFFANPSSANFIIGEQISLTGAGMRNMGNPNQMNDPDTYSGIYWYNGTSDNGGVHTNCGVQNYWFYLLCTGGTGVNDLGKTYSVQAIGIQKATEIAYRNLTVYLSSNSDYNDARFYSIQSAIDLYGQCSPEVISVTNAWYAVGVGEAFSSETSADFDVSQASSCSLPFTVNFINKSLNSTSFTWDFGDGTVSHDINPSHSYNQNGSYTVRLVSDGTEICNNSDTLIKNNLISVSSSGLTQVSCIPRVNKPGTAGILNFRLADINNNSALSVNEGGYVDFSCFSQTTLIAGRKVPVSVTTNPETDESVRIWIDLNNDGIFSESEDVYLSNAQKGTHTGFIIVPEPAYYNVPLRLRVISDLSKVTIQSACFEIQCGQAEDYTVIILQNTFAPIADFKPGRWVYIPGDSVSFENLSLNLPTSYKWSFEGGSPSTSALQNPKVSYAIPGDYTVSLSIRNAYGKDSITISEIVKIRNPLVMGSDNGSAENLGLLFDSGGPNAKYANYEDGSFVITDPCASEIRLAFQFLEIEEEADYIYIYEGSDESGKLLYPLPGVTKYDTLISRTGSAFIHFTSDASIVKRGFAVEWININIGNNKIIADFNTSSYTYHTNEKVTFGNVSSVNANHWQWNFGDGNTSYHCEPVHFFNEPGIKNVSLIASNCYTSDTITKQIIVLPSTLPFNISIPDQEIYIGDLKTINLLDDNKNISDQEIDIELINSDDEVIFTTINKNTLYLQPVSLGKSIVTINITFNNYIISDTFNVAVVNNTVGINEYHDSELKTYPNPAHNKLFFELDGEIPSTVEYSVFAITGELIMNSLIQYFGETAELEVENLDPGVYLIEVRTEAGKYTGKFIRK